MKHPFARKMKSIMAVIILLISVIFLKIKIDSNKQIASIKSETTTTSIIEVKAGSKIYDKQENTSKVINTKSNLFQKEKIEINTKDLKPPDNIDDIDVKLSNNTITILFKKPKDNGNQYEYIVENENGKENMSFYAESGLLGYSYKISNSEKDTSETKVNKIDESPILIQKIDLNKDYYLHIRTVDNNNNFSENKTFKINLPSNGINISYIDSDTGQTIAIPEKISGMINDSYDVSNLTKKISDYVFVETEGNVKGKLQKETLEVKFKYKKQSEIEKVSNVENTTKRENDSKPNVETNIEKSENNKPTEKNSFLKIKYIDIDTNKLIAEEKIVVNKGSNVKVKVKEIEGYTLINNYNYDDKNDKSEDSIIDEIINSLNDEEAENEDLDNALTEVEKKNVITEYEIVMNCDNTDYIVYYKKK